MYIRNGCSILLKFINKSQLSIKLEVARVPSLFSVLYIDCYGTVVAETVGQWDPLPELGLRRTLPAPGNRMQTRRRQPVPPVSHRWQALHRRQVRSACQVDAAPLQRRQSVVQVCFSVVSRVSYILFREVLSLEIVSNKVGSLLGLPPTTLHDYFLEQKEGNTSNPSLSDHSDESADLSKPV